jgi:hypothetical protein
VFADEAMTMQLCTLPAGLKVPGSGIDAAIVGDLFSSKYSIGLNELAEHCNGASTGFANAAEIEVGSTIYISLPIATVLGPAD